MTSLSRVNKIKLLFDIIIAAQKVKNILTYLANLNFLLEGLIEIVNKTRKGNESIVVRKSEFKPKKKIII